jgi:citrate-Mg2+:H+ or citrate-Ca2+:H+ symporter, CitMHS family
MLALLGFLTIVVFLLLIILKKLSVITALVIVPLVFGLLGGFNIEELSVMMFDGIKQVAPTGILLMFAVLYFGTMLETGLFDPIITRIIRYVKGDPLKVIMGTAILTMMVHLDGDGTATFMIVISAFLPVYRQLKINKLLLPCIVALGVGPMHLVPWSGTSARAMATLHTDAAHIFTPNIFAILGGMTWVLFVAYWLGKKERRRLTVIQFDYDHKTSLTEEQKLYRRPKLFWFNAVMTIFLIIILMNGWVPAAVLFVIASVLALLINYPNLTVQQRVLKSHGTNIFLVTGMIFAAGIFSGVLTGSGMIDAMAQSLVSLIPEHHARLLPTLTAITGMPFSMLFTPDAYYFGIMPVLCQAAQHYSIDPLEIGRAALLGQMTVGFPLSPLTASTFLLVGLSEVELGDHQKFTFKWAFGTTIVMTIIALLTESIHI